MNNVLFFNNKKISRRAMFLNTICYLIKSISSPSVFNCNIYSIAFIKIKKYIVKKIKYNFKKKEYLFL